MVIPIFITMKIVIVKKFIEIDHTFMFLVGYLFYWMFPMVFGSLRWFSNQPLMDKWYTYFSRTSDEVKLFYIILCFLYWLLFILGSYFGENSIVLDNQIEKGIELKERILRKFNFRVLFAITAILALISAYQVKDNLFSGYSSNIDPYQTREGVGFLVGLTSTLLAFLLIKTFFNKKTKVSKDFFSIYSLTYIFFAILVFSMGTRLYFLSQFCTIYVYIANYYIYIKTKDFLLLSLFVLSSFTIYGITRLGLSLELDLDNLAFSFFGETVYTSFSLVSFLDSQSINLFQFPFPLISDFTNLLPSFIFPEKSVLVLSYKDIYNLDAPLGAFHSFVSLMINFGFGGALVLLFLTGFFLGRLKRNAVFSEISRLLYVMISGNIAFTVYRDPFSVSIIKNILQFSIIVPMIIYLFTSANKYAKNSK